MKKYLILAATVLTGAVVVFANANAEHHVVAKPSVAGHAAMQAKIDAKFAAIDINKDGKISLDEHNADGKKKFAMRDTNKDGFIDKAEVMAGMHAVKQGAVGGKMMMAPAGGATPAVPAVGGAMMPKVGGMPAVIDAVKK